MVITVQNGNTGAVITAAGMSSRMGAFKPLLEIGGVSFVRRIISVFRQAGVGPIVLVTGNRADELERHVADMDVLCVRNEKYAGTHMFESVKIGFSAIRKNCARILFTPVDIPLFTEETVRSLLASHARLAVPVFGGRQGHPLLVSGELLDGILEFGGTGGLKGALEPFEAEKEKIPVDDAAILRDADTPGEYEMLLRQLGK